MGEVPFFGIKVEEDPIRKIRGQLIEVSRRTGKTAIHLEQGNPVGLIPASVAQATSKLALRQAEVADPSCGYCPSTGHPAFLEAMAHYERDHWGLEVGPDNIFACAGAANGLAAIFSALNVDGKGKGNVIVPAPFFPPYKFYLEENGLELKVAEYDPNETFMLRAIQKQIDPQTQAVLINSPNNPSGRIFSRDFLARLGGILHDEAMRREGKADVLLISDQPYRRLVPEGVEVPGVITESRYPYVIEVNSFSKEARMAGMRMGYGVVSPYFIDPNTGDNVSRNVRDNIARRLISMGTVQASTPLQVALAECELPFELDWSENFDVMKQFGSGLQEIGYEVNLPDGGLFMCVRMPGVRSDRLNAALIEEAVGTADCQYFGLSPEEGYVRLSFFDPSVVQNGEALQRFQSTYHALRSE